MVLANVSSSNNNNNNNNRECTIPQSASFQSRLQRSSDSSNTRRLSIIDRGKSWAKQFIRINKLPNSFSFTQKHSFDSFDSGIDNSSSLSSNASTNSSLNYSSKLFVSSSSSFVPSSAGTSAPGSTSSSSTSCNFDSYKSKINDSNSFESNSSSSKASSSAYLISPTDDEGYLVPIVNFSYKNNLNQNSANNSQLTRSFSTRSAYNTSAYNNRVNYNLNNRVTICEQITSNKNPNDDANNSANCIKCHTKIRNSMSPDGNHDYLEQDYLQSYDNNNNAKEFIQDNLIKVNQAYSLFESFTCATCLALATAEACKKSNQPYSRSNRSSVIVAPSHPPPPLPLYPPPSLQKHIQPLASSTINKSDHQSTSTFIKNNQSKNLDLNKFIESVCHSTKNNNTTNHIETQLTHTSPSNIKITPLIICTNEKNELVLKRNNHQSLINTTTIKCTCNLCKNYTSNLAPNTDHVNIDNNKKQTDLQKDCKIFPINNHKQSTLTRSLSTSSFSSPEEPIIYIDSGDLEDKINMNHLIQKIKHNACNFGKSNNHSSQNQSNHAQSQHDYHVIDENTETVLSKNLCKSLRIKLTPSNSVESFEFFNLNQAGTNNHTISNNSAAKYPPVQLDQHPITNNNQPDIVSYEKSWENSTVLLLDKLKQQELSTIPIPINNQTIRYQTNNLKHQSCCADLLLSQHEKTQLSQERNSNKTISSTASTSSSSSSSYSSASLINQNDIHIQQIMMMMTQPIINSTNKKSEEIEKLLKTDSSILNIENTSPVRSYTTSSLKSDKSMFNSDSDMSMDMESINELWYQPNMPRENVQNYLFNQEIGSFVIRLSNSCRDCFALSIRVPYFANQTGITHYLITKNNKGYKLKGVDKEFKTLKSLVTHYSVMQEILPVTLNLNNSNNNNNYTLNNHHINHTNRSSVIAS